jgi:HK97 family phage prohead protease
MEILAPAERLEYEVKADGRSVEFSGYASVYNIVDLGGDIVMPGAYKNTLARKQKPRMLWNHNTAWQIGDWRGLDGDDSRGLKVEGRLFIGPEWAQTDAINTASNALKSDGGMGLSIGYATKKATRTKEGYRQLVDVDLHEISGVLFPMNQESWASQKSQFGPPEAADHESVMALIKGADSFGALEKALREAGRALSRSEATAVVAQAKHLVQSESESKAWAEVAAIARRNDERAAAMFNHLR